MNKTNCTNFCRMTGCIDTLPFCVSSVNYENDVCGTPLLYLQYIMGSDEYTPSLKRTDNTLKEMIDAKLSRCYNPFTLRERRRTYG